MKQSIFSTTRKKPKFLERIIVVPPAIRGCTPVTGRVLIVNYYMHRLCFFVYFLSLFFFLSSTFSIVFVALVVGGGVNLACFFVGACYSSFWFCLLYVVVFSHPTTSIHSSSLISVHIEPTKEGQGHTYKCFEECVSLPTFFVALFSHPTTSIYPFFFFSFAHSHALQSIQPRRVRDTLI